MMMMIMMMYVLDKSSLHL